MARSGASRGAVRRLAPDPGLVWGVNPVLEALEEQPDQAAELVVQKGRGGPRISRILELARRAGLRPRFVERLEIRGQAAHQGVALRRLPVPLADLDHVLEQGPRLLLALDQVQDPHNLGAMVRTAVAAGADAVLLTRDRSAPLSGVAVKASAGTLHKVPLCRVVNLAQALKKIRAAGIQVLGASSGKGSQSMYDHPFTPPLCLVMGNEGRGLRPLTARNCDALVHIPMPGPAESLNVSAACAVLLFRVRETGGG